MYISRSRPWYTSWSRYWPGYEWSTYFYQVIYDGFDQVRVIVLFRWNVMVLRVCTMHINENAFRLHLVVFQLPAAVLSSSPPSSPSSEFSPPEFSSSSPDPPEPSSFSPDPPDHHHEGYDGGGVVWGGLSGWSDWWCGWRFYTSLLLFCSSASLLFSSSS